MRRTSDVITSMLCLVVMGLTAAAPASAAATGTPPTSLRAAFHVHSTMSTGTLSLESLAKRAEQQQLDVLVLSENFTLRYDYGFHPFDGFLAYRVHFPSVMEFGIQRFLDEVRTVQQRHPNLIIIPGVEVAPHYYWTGSLLQGNLTMHNAQRNLLVIGLQKAEDYEGLPSRGNAGSFVWNRQSLANGLPLLLLVPVVGLLKSLRHTSSTRTMSKPRFRWVLSAMLLLICSGLLVNAWPIKMPPYSSHDGGLGYQPYQALIDNAIDRGALVFWSMTEARDFSQHAFGPLGTVTVKTEPHPEALVLTEHYTGFGGLYQEARRAVTPGGVWDQIVASRFTADHKNFPTLIGEVAFHGTTDAGKDLDRVYTVINSSERTAESVLAALRTGHVYAVARGEHNVLLQLDEFQVSHHDDSADIGDTIENSGSGGVRIRVGVSTIDQKPHRTTLRIIRSGHIIKQIERETPLRIELMDHEAHQGEWQHYRLELVGASGELLTNPIYVAPRTEAHMESSQRPDPDSGNGIKT
ncbi:MAG: hypothetical protein CV089_04705 [Nitrospira sp. WS110]|nr:hypothetical protein [Nitrospira sp. WS110]